MPKPRQPKGVRPLVKHSRAYEQAMKREFLDPWMDQLRSRLATATSVSDAYHFLNQAVAVLEATPRAGIPITVIIEALGRVRDYNRSRMFSTFRSALGVDIRPFLSDVAIQPFMAEKVVENIDLIKTIPRRFQEGMRADVLKAFQDKPFDRQELTRIFQDKYKSSGYNLRRIVRDQSNKFNGELTQVRQQQLGIGSYEWSTSDDERVRPTHRDKEGKPFEWANPPLDTGHPGNDVQCRCLALAIVTPQNRKRLGGK